MRKLITITLALVLVPMLFGFDKTDAINQSNTPTKMAPKKLVSQKIIINQNALKGIKGILYSQIPDTITAWGMASQKDSVYPFDADCADDILLPAGTSWSIDSVTSWWWTSVITNWSSVPNIHFLVYQDSGTIPPMPVDSPFIELVVEQANYTAIFNGIGWHVDMALPVPVNLTEGHRYWVEIKPSLDFTINGQTYIIGDLVCGNGQELWFRMPVLSWFVWTPATTVFGSPYEMGFILYGSLIGVEEGPNTAKPISFGFAPSMPNPAKGSVSISYSLTLACNVALKIYDRTGRLVETLVQGKEEPGTKIVNWDARNIPNGTYFLRLETEDNVATQKLILVK